MIYISFTYFKGGKVRISPSHISQISANGGVFNVSLLQAYSVTFATLELSRRIKKLTFSEGNDRGGCIRIMNMRIVKNILSIG